MLSVISLLCQLLVLQLFSVWWASVLQPSDQAQNDVPLESWWGMDKGQSRWSSHWKKTTVITLSIYLPIMSHPCWDLDIYVPQAAGILVKKGGTTTKEKNNIIITITIIKEQCTLLWRCSLAISEIAVLSQS